MAGSYTTSQFVPLLRLAALRRGIYLHLFEADLDSYAQMVLDPNSALYEFEPDYVVLARHEGAVGFPPFTEDVDRALDAEVTRWKTLWDTIRAVLPRACDSAQFRSTAGDGLGPHLHPRSGIAG